MKIFIFQAVLLLENILTVIALSHALGTCRNIHRIISEFHGVEHRLERVKTIDVLHLQ